MLKKVLSYVLCVIICLSLIIGGLTSNAAILEKGTLTVATIDGITGDSVIVPITLADNPGIMAVSISITYNSDALTYEGFDKGVVLNDYMVVDHPTKKLIRLVSLCRSNTTNDGYFISFKFKIKDNAPMGLTPINIEYGSGDFCNKELDRIMPTIVKGGINIAYNGSNCAHKEYGEWTVASSPSCDAVGHNQRICKSCGHTELKETSPLGHEYPDFWTVTKEAKPDEDGTMARLCIRCKNPVDEISFPYKDAEDGKVENEEDKPVTDEDYAEDKFEEQNPGKKPTPQKPEFKPNSSTTDNTVDTETNPNKNEVSSSTDNSDKTTSTNSNLPPDKTESSISAPEEESKTENNIVEDAINSIVDKFTNEETVNKVTEENKNFTERIENTKAKVLEVIPKAEEIADFYKSLLYFIVLILFI